MKGWKSPVNLPLMRGQGSYKHKDDTYRFLVIDRLESKGYIFSSLSHLLGGGGGISFVVGKYIRGQRNRKGGKKVN